MRLKPPKMRFFSSLLGAVILATTSVSTGTENMAQGMPLPEPAATISQVNEPPLQGYWKIDITVTKETNRGSDPNYEMLAYFYQVGSEFSGQFLETSGNACKEVSITGSIDGERVNWTVFYTGSCCQGAKMRFEGVMVSPTVMKGKLSPVGSTPSNCTLWWADVTLTKQNY